MAFGSELYLGIMGYESVMSMIKDLGLEYSDDEGLVVTDRYKDLQAQLAKAHTDALREMGLEVYDHTQIQRSDGSSPSPNYVYVKGRDGKVRETCIWSLEVDYDPREMGHRKEDMLVGVSLISRYFPVFLDWNKDCGGSGDTISLTPEVLENIEIARKHLAGVLPLFIAEAPIVFRERHY